MNDHDKDLLKSSAKYLNNAANDVTYEVTS